MMCGGGTIQQIVTKFLNAPWKNDKNIFWNIEY